LTQRVAWFERFEGEVGMPLGMSAKTLASRFPAQNFSELEQFCLDVRRRYVLTLPSADIKRIVVDRLRQWKDRVGPATAAKD
jgi:hypothetical protein